MACNLRTACVGCVMVKYNEIWASGIPVKHVWGTFPLVVFKVIIGSDSVHLSENGV